MYVPTTALALNTVMYKRIVMILHVSAFSAILREVFNKEKDSNGYLCHSHTVVDLQYKYYSTGSACISITLRSVHVTVVAAEKQKVLHILGVSVVLGMQHAMHMHHAIRGLSLQYLAT
jgi:Na+-transporting NADH:ubiquinone oxidoreductase subunit NqrB